MNSDLFSGTTVLITGASSGIGAAFARLLAPTGARLVIHGRDVARLEEIAGEARARGAASVDLILGDLANAGGVVALLEEVEGRGLQVDHLVNNAGLGRHGRAVDVPVEAQLGVIDVNTRAATELALRLLPGMVARGRGGVLNVASTAAFQGLAWLSVYAGTKAYLLTWSEAVHHELRGTGVRCSCLCPGPVDTHWFAAAGMRGAPPAFLLQSPEAVARAGLRGYRANASHVISGPLPRTGAWLTRLFPRALVARVAALYATPRGAG